MNDFQRFSTAVHARYNALSMGELFRVNVEADELWAAYLAAFPEDTNPIFRERTEHDCSCCRNFIKNLGRIVGLKDGEIITVWGELDLPYPYDFVARTLDDLVRSSSITGVYRTKEVSYGAQFNHERTEGGDVLTWHHFHGTVFPQHRHNDAASVAGELNSTAGVFKRGLVEITADSLQTTLGLIAQNALYRGAEFQGAVAAFQQLQNDYLAAVREGGGENFHWANFQKPGARIRNTAIGTLLQNLSEGMPLEQAVAAFEKTVAPENYKRTTALITPGMIEAAMSELRSMDLESAVHRRFARLSDVSINNVLWASNTARYVMRDSLTDALMASSQVKKTQARQGYLDISADEFFSRVVPKAESLEVLVANHHANNFVSLTAPAAADVGQLFKWDNNFGWSYNGNVTDSIKEKVKRAGGNTDAPLRVSLNWFNPDDLDIHCECPDGYIDYGNKGGILDVDMNAYGPKSATDPVENLQWMRPRNGTYRVKVNQFSRRTGDRPGFVLEVENNGKLTQYSYQAPVVGMIEALQFTVKDGIITDLTVGKGLIGQGISREVWGIPTEQYAKVETLLLSPNHWDDNKNGNKHYLFMLEGCKNPEPARGIYNEYLIPEFDKHRKVFEVLGAKTMCPVTDDQLSGIGFSSTRNDLVTIRATSTEGAIEIFNVQF